MTSLQCPNCGADLRVEDSAQGFVVCRYCDSRISLTGERTPEQNRAESERQAQLEEQRIARELELARAQREAAERELAVGEARKEAAKRAEEERQALRAGQRKVTQFYVLMALVSFLLFIILLVNTMGADHVSALRPLVILACIVGAVVFVFKAAGSSNKENHL